jgi:hypothetical protein
MPDVDIPQSREPVEILTPTRVLHHHAAASYIHHRFAVVDWVVQRMD